MLRKITKIIVRILKIITCFWGALLLFLILAQIKTKNDDLINVKDYRPGNISAQERTNVLHTLQIYQDGFAKRDVSIIDQFVDETFCDDDVLILGTQPSEFNFEKEGAKKLLYTDWKYWGNITFYLDKVHLDQYENTVYMAMGGVSDIDVEKVKVPLRITGLLVKENNQWLISKLQFQYEINTRYTRYIWAVTRALLFFLALTLLLMLFVKIGNKFTAH
jgi:hypothetical protein